MLRIVGRAGLLGAVIGCAFIVQAAQGGNIGPDPRTSGRQDRLVGLWDVEVALGPCGGPVGPPFQALHQFHLGGTGQVVPSSNPTALSSHLLVWKHVGGNRFQAAMKFFRYDANGVAIGFNIVTNNLTLSEDGTAYEGTGLAEFFTLDGDYQFAVCPRFVGTRFTG